MEEMRRFAEASGFATHRGLVLDFGVARGHDPVRSILLGLLGSSPSSGADERRGLADRLFAEEVVARDSAAFLNDLLELPQTTEQRALYDAMGVPRANGASARVEHCSRQSRLLSMAAASVSAHSAILS
jgi:hypothetical protein